MCDVHEVVLPKSKGATGWRKAKRWLLLIVLLLAIYTFGIEPRWVEVTSHTVPIRNLPSSFEGFTIVQLTDFHYKVALEEGYYQRVIERTNALQPDLVVLTGDFVPLTAQHIPGFTRLVLQFTAKHGVVAILGNHDHLFRDAVREGVRAGGATVLWNSSHRVTQDGQAIWIAGLDDLWHGRPDFAEMMRGIPAGATTILLAHEPDIADQAAQYPIALQLSGHSHGGQVRFPWIGPLHLPRDCTKYPCGRYQVGDMVVYTNRGIGGGSIFHLITPRFNCRPEIAHFTLTKAR